MKTAGDPLQWLEKEIIIQPGRLIDIATAIFSFTQYIDYGVKFVCQKFTWFAILS